MAIGKVIMCFNGWFTNTFSRLPGWAHVHNGKKYYSNGLALDRFGYPFEAEGT